MSVIKQMDEILANKIAAGEVVEKCASVVKELVENSIDAKSNDIKIELKEAGIAMIRVTDNGIGMDKLDAINCFNRHATSKIIEEEDLYHINTLGFRGEALASIASVSKVNLKTSQGNVGTIVSIEGGKVVNVSNGDARIGTIIEVSDLFYNTPARLKYMKSTYAELANISDYISKIALSFPNIRFTLINNDKVVIKTDGRGNLLKTIGDIYGIDIAKKMMYIENENDDFTITGYISKPDIERANRNHMITLVNGRVVKNIDVLKKIKDAYSNYMPDTKFPVTIINILVDPVLVDVNIHPTKMDVKFSKMDNLLDLLYNTINDKLNVKTLIPKVEKIEKKVVYQEVLDLTRSNNIVKEEYNFIEKPILSINDIEKIEEEVKKEEEKEIIRRLPELYVVGLVHGTYIVCQNEEGMYLIDQHAAMERINYELYKDNLASPKKDSMQLLFPFILEYTAKEFIILKNNINILLDMGFDISEFGINSFAIKAHPAWLPKDYVENSTRKIIDVLIEEESNFDLGKFNDNISKTIACKMSVKANTNQTKEELESIVTRLRNCINPFNCPHGRPTMIFYNKLDLEKEFKRTGF
ncbi:MAG: DNA mismatch repair endonuclease MutL [Bacilli bacterium]|nr:DNA mismatch repair endonuclease MutL [Bacilli bacterium]